MEAAKFTLHAKYARAYEQIKAHEGAEAARDFLQAICEYGWWGIEPEGYSFAATLAADNFREDVDHSKAAFVGGERSGEARRAKRRRKKEPASSDSAEPTSQECAEPTSDVLREPPSDVLREPPSQECAERGSAENDEPNQYIPIHTNTYQCSEGIAPRNSAREPPTVEELSTYAEMMGYASFDAERCWAHYASQGWVKGNGMPVTDPQALVRTWMLRDESEGKDVARKEERVDWSNLGT